MNFSVMRVLQSVAVSCSELVRCAVCCSVARGPYILPKHRIGSRSKIGLANMMSVLGAQMRYTHASHGNSAVCMCVFVCVRVCVFL